MIVTGRLAEVHTVVARAVVARAVANFAAKISHSAVEFLPEVAVYVALVAVVLLTEKILVEHSHISSKGYEFQCQRSHIQNELLNRRVTVQ